MPSTIEQLRNEQSHGAIDLLSTLRMIEINPVELCNRSCNFCPRSDASIYPNRNDSVDLSTITKIANDLKTFNYTGRIGFVGFGEPTLYKHLLTAIKIIKETVSNLTWLEVNTNGDYLNRKLIADIVAVGCTHLTVSMYDFDDSEKFINMVDGLAIQLTLRHHYDQQQGYNLILVNRTDLAGNQSKQLDISNPCYLPFYKMFIDYTGDVLVCNNDWGRNSYLGNVHLESIQDIWLGKKFNEYRKHLIAGERNRCVPCSRCNIIGNKYGADSVAVFSKVLS